MGSGWEEQQESTSTQQGKDTSQMDTLLIGQTAMIVFFIALFGDQTGAAYLSPQKREPDWAHYNQLESAGRPNNGPILGGRPRGGGIDSKCPEFEPFRCPEERKCISIQYLCDGADDCSDGYDEDVRLCTAARRPPVEETASFLKSLLASHGPDYLARLFGTKARNMMRELGGVGFVAIQLSECRTLSEFCEEVGLGWPDQQHIREVFLSVERGDLGILKSIGIQDSEVGDMKFFFEKLINTGFLD